MTAGGVNGRDLGRANFLHKDEPERGEAHRREWERSVRVALAWRRKWGVDMLLIYSV